MKTLAIMQPTYLPWLGFFDLMKRADLFILYDHVQYVKHSRNKVRNREGAILLSVPVVHTGRVDVPINQVEIADRPNFRKKHLDTIRFNYCKAQNFKKYFGELEAIYRKNHRLLVDLNYDLIFWGREKLGITTELKRSSALDIPKGGRVSTIVSLCKQFGAQKYYSPMGAKAYIDEDNLFEQEGVILEYQRFEHPVHPQLHYDNFISHLSFIDFLFNVSEEDIQVWVEAPPLVACVPAEDHDG